MASTIKLKNSTTKGNTPSSLEQGEVAINVNDGNLFYGNGSAVLQNFTFNHITASGNISASGTIIANKIITTQITSSFVTSSTFILTTHITSSGNSIFGNDATDTHTFTGAITASGNISASGTVTANSASLSGRINVSGRSQFGSTSATQTSHQFKGISGDTNVFSLFDKDGDEMININGVIGDNTSNFTIGDIGTAGNGTLIKIEDHNNRTFISNDGKDGFFGINTTTPDKALVVMGNVSSSGTISGTTYNSRGKQVISYASFFNKIQVGTKSDSLPVSINGNITASGNIWVSGSGNNIYLNNNGNITSSGNISASLNSKIFASSASFGGASFLRSFNVKGAGLEGRLSLQGAAGTDNPGIEFTVNDNTSRALIRLDQVGTNGTALEFFTEPDGGDIANTLTIGHTGHITASGNINTTGNINVTGSVSASNFIGAPIQIVTHAWFSNQTSKFPAGDLSHLMNGNSNFGWADRAWNDSVTKTEVFDNDQLNGVNDHNKGVPIQHNVTDIQLTGYMRASNASDVTEMNYWIFKGNQANGSGPTITFLASASAATVGTNYNEVYITGSTGLQADAGDLIFVFANTDVGGTGTDRNIRGMYTVTAKIRE